jgi:OHCU decarboxylase
MPQTTLDHLNTLPEPDAIREFRKCCGSERWARRMVINRPYLSPEDLSVKAADLWWDLDRDDWFEAFRSHPKIGEKKPAAEVSTQSQAWSGQEQASVENAGTETLSDLVRLNREYEEKFGFIYIVCATGKSSEEMLEILKSRINNDAEDELMVAATEQAKITELRLRKMIDPDFGL